jgi:pilin isopeptide linkage protein
MKNVILVTTEELTRSIPIPGGVEEGGVLNTGILTVDGDMTVTFTQANISQSVRVPLTKTLTLNKTFAQLTDAEKNQLKGLEFKFNMVGDPKNPENGAVVAPSQYTLRVGDKWDDKKAEGSTLTWEISKAWGISFSKPGAYHFKVTEVNPGVNGLYTSDTTEWTLTYYVVEEGAEGHKIYRVAEECELDRTTISATQAGTVQNDIPLS